MKGISVEHFYVLFLLPISAIGLLTNGGNIPVWNPASEEVKSACLKAADYCSNNNADLARLSLR